MCVCVCERERECVCVREREREKVCVREREFWNFEKKKLFTIESSDNTNND